MHLAPTRLVSNAHHLTRNLLGTLGLLTLCLPGPVVAEQEPIQEVLVTATRRPASVNEIATALSLVDDEALWSEQLVTDALAGNVGVYLQQTTPGQGAPIIRGLKGSAILHLVDGMRLNNAIFRSAPTQYLALVPVTAIERIEVLRGTPASLYGTDAVGGVVQLVTRVPQIESEEREVRGDLLFGLDSAELTKTVRGTLDVGSRSFVTSISGEYSRSGNRSIGGGDRIAPSAYESRAGRLLLAGTPEDNRSWLIDVHYLEQPDTPRVDELVPGFGQAEPSSSEFAFAPNRRVFVHGRLRQLQGLLGLDWNVDAAWQRVDDDRVSRDFGADDRRLENNASDLYGMTASASRASDSGSWIVGAEYYVDRVSSERRIESLVDSSISSVAPRFPDGAEVRQASLYANGSLKVSSRSMLSGGLRVSVEDVSLPATPTTTAASIDVSDTGADIGWLFDASETWQLVANLGIGFRAPNVFDVGALGERPGNRFNVPNTDLESEHVVQADFGVRYRSDDARVEVTLYKLDYEDRITSVLTGDVAPGGRDIVQSVNAAKASIYGLEAGADFTLSETLRGSAVLNYTRGEQRISGAGDEPADRIPPLTGSIGITFDPGRSYRIEGRLNFAAEQDRLSARDARDVRIDPNGTDGWATLDLHIAWDSVRDWQIGLGVDNLFDERYRVHGSGLDAPGRNAYVTLRRRY